LFFFQTIASFFKINYLQGNICYRIFIALLSSENGDTERISIEIEEAQAMGLEILPPDVNESLAHFTTLADGKIRFGLAAIKGIGESSVRQIIAIRDEGGKFSSLEDFAKRVPSKILNKKFLESLAKSGALDSLCERGTLVAQYAKVVEFSKSVGDAGASQTDMFAMAGGDSGVGIAFDAMDPASSQQKLAWEKETLGLYVSSHPLAGLRKYIGKKARLIDSLSQDDVGRKITIAGIVESVKVLRTKKGESMAILSLEDPTGKMEITLFPRTYAQAQEALERPDTVLVLAGTMEMRMGLPQLRADVVKRASLSTMIEKAREAGMYDEEGARSWRPRTKPAEEQVETLTEEGEVVVEKVSAESESAVASSEFLGPVSMWIMQGMDMNEPASRVGVELGGSAPASVTRISVHTIELPERASKQLLMELKAIFETFPGREKVQLKIGERVVPVSLTIAMSPILEKRIADAVAKFAGTSASA
jgi:DNA polymerase III alpha subunit